MPTLTARRQHILTGAVALLLVASVTTVAVKGAFGAFQGGYRLIGSFDAAGQGLLPGSDVKVRGVNIGEVQRIDLVDGRAEVVLRIKSRESIPVDASAVIRPKTLFGEKYVDIAPGPNEQSGPFLADGGEITNTLGGFELETVLADTFPLLQAIDPADLMTVLGEFAEGGRDLGETINRTLVNGEELAALFARNAGNTEQFLTDLAALSGSLADDAQDILDIADAANLVLPTLNEREDDVVDLLRQTGRLSNDVADLLVANPDFIDAMLRDGSRTLQLLYDERNEVVPLVIGLRQYLESLASIVRIDVGDGTLMAAVKGILGGDACGALPCGGGVGPTGTAGAPDPGPGSERQTPLPTLPLPLPLQPLVPGPSGSSSTGIFDLLTRVLGG